MCDICTLAIEKLSHCDFTGSTFNLIRNYFKRLGVQRIIIVTTKCNRKSNVHKTSSLKYGSQISMKTTLHCSVKAITAREIGQLITDNSGEIGQLITDNSDAPFHG